jgi:hypothetical protein
MMFESIQSAAPYQIQIDSQNDYGVIFIAVALPSWIGQKKGIMQNVSHF